MAWRANVFGLLLLGLFSLAGCTSYPLGIDKATWENMTLEQQQAAYHQQAQLRAEREARQQAHELELAQLKQRAFEQAGYGDTLQCILREGQVIFNRDSYAILPNGFRVIKGFTEVMDVEYQRQYATSHYSNAFNVTFDGMRISLCEGSQQWNCNVNAGTTRELARGITTQLQTSAIQVGLYCELDQQPLRQRSIRP